MAAPPRFAGFGTAFAAQRPAGCRVQRNLPGGLTKALHEFACAPPIVGFRATSTAAVSNCTLKKRARTRNCKETVAQVWLRPHRFLGFGVTSAAEHFESRDIPPGMFQGASGGRGRVARAS